MTQKRKRILFFSIFNSRLAKKQLIFILLFSSLITLIGTFIQLLVEYRDDIEYIDMQLLQIKNSHLESLTNSLWSLNNKQIEIQLHNILNLRDIVYLEIVEKETILFSTQRPEMQNLRHVSYPMIFTKDGVDSTIGVLNAYASLSGVYQRMMKKIFLIFTTQALKTFIVSFFILYIIYRTVIQHLIKLSNFAQTLSLDNLDSKFEINRIKSTNPDELDLLVDTLNHMRQRLNKDFEVIRQTKIALNENREQFKNLYENAPNVYFSIGMDGCIKRCNRRINDLLGCAVEDLIDRPFLSLYEDSPAGKDKARMLLKRFQAGESISDEELQMKKADGTPIWTSLTVKAIQDEQGQTVEHRSVIVDITYRKKAEEMLRNRELLLNEMGNIAKIGGWEHDLVSRKSTWTKTTYKIIEIKPGDRIPGPDEHLDYYPPEHRKILEKAYHSSIETGEQFDIEVQCNTAKGRLLWVRVLGRPEYVNGECVRMKGTIQDITEQKKVEVQLLQAQKMESVGRLAGGVAHDFNNMLSIIIGNAELILEEMDSANPHIANLREIYKAAERSANLTRQLLAFARKQIIAPKVLAVNTIMESMLNMLKRLIGEDIELIWLPSEKLWQVKMDPSQIDQILVNLCVNARDAIKGVGKIIIETDNITFNETYCSKHIGFIPGNYTMISFTDNGCGMDSKTLDTLYEPFFTTKKTGEGSGLGLATVYGIVKQNKGFINVYSEPGMGTTFKIYLPRHYEIKEKKPKKATEQETVNGHETILLVEDEKAILKMTTMMLKRLGYSVLTASTPDEAIGIVKNTNSCKIDLLMTDVIMPGMNGQELSKKLTCLYPSLKCLFMSGYTANVIAHRGILDKGVKFISKPFSKQDLAVKIRELLDKTEDNFQNEKRGSRLMEKGA